MNKTTGALLASVLVATPLLTLLLGIQSQSAKPIWQLPPDQFLQYARLQPYRLASAASFRGQQSFFGKAVHNTGAAVKALPDYTLHAAGSALVTLKDSTAPMLRSFREEVNALVLYGRKQISQVPRALHSWRAQYVQNVRDGLHLAHTSVTGVPGYLHHQQTKLRAGLELARASSWYNMVNTAVYVQSLPEMFRPFQRAKAFAKDFWEWFGPGGRLHPSEFIERYRGHLIVEGLLAVVICYLLFQSSFKWSSVKSKPLTEEEVDALCEEWQPEPLTSSLKGEPLQYEAPIISSMRACSTTGTWVTANGKKALNMVAFNFLGTAGDPNILEACKATVTKYGVGACGPRGFYGTIDVHLDLEERLAKFMGRQESIIYSYDLSTIPSVLPAFANAKDLIVMDEAADFAIQNGANLSRAIVQTFKHNDLEDLERVLRTQVELHKKLRKPLNRRFIVVEGIYKALGDLAPLGAIARLKHKYKFRLVVDESLALGVLGPTGRGACEHFGLQKEDVEIVCASMSNSLASVGGFCVGEREIIDHQRLSGLGYCFSAALPPYLATAAIGSLDVLEQRGPQLLEKLQANSRHLRTQLAGVEGLQVVGGERDMVSPVVHVRLAESADNLSWQEAQQTLQKIVDEALRRDSVLFTVNHVSGLDKVRLAPSIRVAVTADHKTSDIEFAVNVLQIATATVLHPKDNKRTPQKSR